MRRTVVALSVFALAACERGGAPEAPTAPEPPATVDPAAEPIEGEADSAWVELMGAWAPPGACGDYTKEWRIEGEMFHLHEMHCDVERLELLQNGVRAIADCTVEGDNDGVEDVFKFVRRPDATLSVIIESNEAVTDGLVMCDGEAP